VQRNFRLTRSEDFKRVRRDGKSYAHPLVVLIALNSENNEHSRVRVGVAAGKSVGTAVIRNRTKRLLREAMRTPPKHRLESGPGLDCPPRTWFGNSGGYATRSAQPFPARQNFDPQA
jgi:ribonuclease P protein component